MAKENSLSPLVLFIASGLLLAGGVLMPTFPVFIFVGLAPLFALTDRAADTSAVWEKMEWVLLSVVLYFLASHSFDLSFTIWSMIYGILFTLPFIGHVWVRQTLGSRAGKITIILFWLALEYTALKIQPQNAFFLADTLRLHSDWTRWNPHTGYLGASFWILLTNLVAYHLLLSDQRFRWYWLITFLLIFAGPLIYSLFLDSAPLTRKELVDLYVDKLMVNVTYLAQGEFVVRTAAWVSILILLFTFVKSQTSKR